MSLPENGFIYRPSLPAINLVADYIMFPLWTLGILSQSVILYTILFKFKGAYSTNNKFVIVISVCDWFTAAGCIGIGLADWIRAAGRWLELNGRTNVETRNVLKVFPNERQFKSHGKLRRLKFFLLSLAYSSH
jgi:hypothetical protein